MSLFIAGLAYGEGAAELDAAKVGILAASLIAGAGGFVILRNVGNDAANAARP
jgi:Na+/H+ antiporter NhaA